MVEFHLVLLVINMSWVGSLFSPKRYTGIWEPVHRKAIANKDIKRLKVIYVGCQRGPRINRSFSAHRRFMIMVFFTIPIRSQSIFLVVVVITRDPRDCPDHLEVLATGRLNVLVHGAGRVVRVGGSDLMLHLV